MINLKALNWKWLTSLKIFLLPLVLGTGPLSFSSPLVSGGNVEVSLVSEYRVVPPGKTVYLGILLDMEEHWHTYWKNSGDSGGPTHVEWALPDGLSVGELEWPEPSRIETPPLVSFGYEEEVMLLAPLTLSPGVSPGSKNIKAHVKWLECAEVCIPGEKTLNLTLNVKEGVSEIDPSWIEKFTYFKNRLPIETGLWMVSGKEDADFFLIELNGEGDLGNVSFFPEDKKVVSYSGEQVLKRNKDGFTLRIPKSDLLEGQAGRLRGVLVSSKGWRGPGSEPALAVDIPLTQVSSVGESASLWLYVLFAFLGGLILNLMPCVLPVLSVKVLGLVKSRHLTSLERKIQGWGYTAGVLFSFWVLAGILLAVRAGGERLGWGFQLQNPLMVGGLAGLFTLLTLNLFGVFEIGAGLGTLNASSGQEKKEGAASSFLTGVLATIVATPCTAPFMGVALGFALTQPPLPSFAVFSALGFGLALPYLFLTYFPALLSFLPKPGPWMDNLKRVLGILLGGTAVWLTWVFSLQVSPVGTGMLLGGLGAFAIGAFFFGNYQRKSILGKKAAMEMAGFVLLGFIGGILVLSASFSGEQLRKNIVPSDGIWSPYSPEAVKEGLRQGRPVFVDFTAAWCLTCQVNERVVFSRADVRSKFEEKSVLLLKADWTLKDPVITDALEKMGRSGVPVYALHTPENEEPEILPPLLTPDMIIDRLNKI